VTESYGGFWRRSIAFFIDQVVLGITYVLLLFAGGLSHVLGKIAGGGLPPDVSPDAGSTAAAVDFLYLYLAAVLVVTVLYYTCLAGEAGQTPGKMLLGLRVRPEAGGAMTFGIALLRLTGYLVSGALFYLGFLWVAFDPRRQGWHDKIAGTVVTRNRGDADLP